MIDKQQMPERPTVLPSTRLMNKLTTSPLMSPLKVNRGLSHSNHTSPNFLPQRILTPHSFTSNSSNSHEDRHQFVSGTGQSSSHASSSSYLVQSSLSVSPLLQQMHGTTNEPDTSQRLYPSICKSNMEKELPQLPPMQDDNGNTLDSTATAPLFGLGINGTAGAVQDESVAGPSTDTSNTWLNRRAAIKSAQQQASAGLIKFGKASAAKIKQAQQRPLLRHANNGTLINGMGRYDGRASKSTADLPTSSQMDENIPAIPAFRTPDPNIGLPTDVKHNVHVDVGPNGYIGLPASWAQVLTQYGIDNSEDVKRDPASAAKIVQERTEYYIAREAEQGHDPEKTRRFLKSQLENFIDLKEAVAANAGLRLLDDAIQHDSISTDVTSKEAVRKVFKPLQPSTSYTTSLDALWPSSAPPSQLDKHASPYICTQDASPILPEVQAVDDDWMTSLLNSIPASSSNSSSSSKRRISVLNRRRSIDGLDFDLISSNRNHQSSTVQEQEMEERLQDGEDVDSELGDSEEDDLEAATTSIATAKMQIAGVAKPYLTSSTSTSLSGSRDQLANRTRSRSGSSTPNSLSANSIYQHLTHSPSAAAAAAHLGISPSESITGNTSYFSTTLQTSSSPVPTLSTSTSPSPSSTDRPSTASDQAQIGIGLGLRDRRKASPRIYPPALNKYIPKEDNLSPFSAYGFKRGSAGGIDDCSFIPQSIAVKSRHHIVPSQSSLDRESNSSHSHSQGSHVLSKDVIPNHRADSEKLSNAGSSVDEASLRSFGIEKERQRMLDGPPLPPKAARVPIGQTVPDFILPDESGFYSVDKQRKQDATPSIKLESTKAVCSVSNSPIENRDASVITQQSPLYSVFSDQSYLTTKNGASSSHSPVMELAKKSVSPLLLPTLQEDGQHEATNFIEDWLKGDYTCDPTSPISTTISSSHYSTTKSISTSPRQFVPIKHQSSSPALLQALPLPFRSNSNDSYSTSKSTPLAEVKSALLNKSTHNDKNDSKWKLIAAPDTDKTALLNPFSSDTIELESRLIQNDNQNSILSLPSEIDTQTMESESLVNVSVAVLLRTNSRQSRSSSRNGSKRINRPTPRRSSDAKRFPLSMHYASGISSDAFDYEEDEMANGFDFAEMVKARQSMDLDDVMPSSLSQHSQLNAVSIPPVPPLPNRTSNHEERESLPASIEHLKAIIRMEDPCEIVGDLVMIGEGESGHVYSSIPRNDCVIPSLKGRGKVAVKVVQIPRLEMQKSLDEFGRLEKLDKEIVIWKRGQEHRNIVNLYDVFISHEINAIHPGIWVIQEFMSMSLADLVMVKSCGLEMNEKHISRIMLDTALALEHLHGNNIIHRDVRSDNVLLTFDGVSKLTDFTHASHLSRGEKVNGMIGTAYWMAPEVIQGNEYDEKVDIWSLGVVLFELIEGVPPRVDLPPLQAITLTAKQGLPGLSQPNSFSASLRQCLSWCTEMNPEQRPSADTLPLSNFLSSPGSYSQVADLMEEARSLESNLDSSLEEETLDDDLQVEKVKVGNTSIDRGGNVRDSWHSQSTVHA